MPKLKGAVTAKRKSRRAAVAASRDGDVAAKRKKAASCPIVGIGGSAGGFEAAMELLHHLPRKNGMAFVIVQHLDPSHASRLADLLGRVTEMPVMEVNKRLKPEPNTVYVQPPNKCVILKRGALTLIKRTERLNLAIDHFFESLADEQGSRAIGVVLSGSGSDGTAGLRAIKAAGGLTFAQDEESAKFPSMPQHAIQSGFVDAALTPQEIAEEICRVAGHPYIKEGAKVGKDGESPLAEPNDIHRIFLTLRRQTGVDFSAYKQTTLLRRIQRRMALHRIERVEQYARFLRDQPDEVDALFNDLLINVTRFFRDNRVFEVLKKKFIPSILEQRGQKGQLRVWVPGCATGEEVYSLAIAIIEALGRKLPSIRVQIFGTDLSEHAISRARLGVYSSAIEKDVSPERLSRFFQKLDSTYRINRMVRDLCTFARQNITADPPFSRIDLISCRNVLIYLGPELQKRCLPVFHYALNAGGYLILGPAETVGIFGDLFELVERRAKIYAKKRLHHRPELDIRDLGGGKDLTVMDSRRMAPVPGGDDFNTHVQQMADRILVGNYAPCGVVIDSNMAVRYFRGQTGRYLEHTSGTATLNLVHMARPGLLPNLRNAIHRAFNTNQSVRRGGGTVTREGKVIQVNMEVVPFRLRNSDGKWALVIFNEVDGLKKETPKSKAKNRKKGAERDLQALHDDLAATKESLQAIIEEQEATNEELKSANEEIESSNEELQSTNEELETAKEELQSTNEELTTLNEELSNRNMEMIQVNSDLNNLLSSVHIPILMVDNALNVRRATPTARSVFNIMETDIGRPLRELKPNIEVPDLQKLLRDVIDTLSIHERKVRDGKGRVFSLRIRPYRTADNRIDGAVVTLVDLKAKNETRGKE